jgi:hypothetical protein
VSDEGQPTTGFMYLELRYDEEDHGLRATIKKTGELRSHRSVGTEHSRWNGVAGIFAIDGFDGLDVISTEELLREIMDRLGPERILELMGAQLPKAVLLKELEKRLAQSR